MDTAAKNLTDDEGYAKAVLPLLMSIFLVVSYVFATRQAFIWIGNELESSAFMAALLVVFIGPILLIWKFGGPDKPLSLPAVILAASCGLLSILTFPILQQLSASFAILGAYGFFTTLSRVSTSSWRTTLSRVSTSSWRKGLVMAGLTALALPFALVPGTGMGFYLRLLTADAAAQILAMIGHASLGAHDVLIFDNGIAQVDLPCSGLKSLFTGTGFFFVASLIMGREVNLKWMIGYAVFAGLLIVANTLRVNLKWMIGYAVFAGLLIVANTLRVTLLIWVSEILEYRDIAETIHMPLGVMLFCLVCTCAVFILIKLAPVKRKDNSHKREDESAGRAGVISSFFVAIALLTTASP